ncbi:Endonuclease/exonuclease/phosphatase [Artemisia annua]|uniref:Endonuclease/exonuclease/phosphatase n=1 Tax=Artemisia annua TaxID=35608 RepID=A0A2U1NPT8_ARTAN|nr:Endonuclease/exonuclease/phosphatase [Artemisia annua]
MVGIFLTVWVRSKLMGYLRNKGSVSVSMLLHQTSFCFVCTHLTSGEKEGDELRRNSDFMEIVKKTSRIIWLGDLNYRIALCYRSAKALVEMQNWRALLEKIWCDRILWYGRGLHQLSYLRGESRFSDHRPVYSLFWAVVELVHSRFRRTMSCSSSRIEVEELLPYAKGYTELCFF